VGWTAQVTGMLVAHDLSFGAKHTCDRVASLKYKPRNSKLTSTADCHTETYWRVLVLLAIRAVLVRIVPARGHCSAQSCTVHSRGVSLQSLVQKNHPSG
jgi:hypothetical protein